MADHGTAIEWTQAPGFKGETWNPVTGCDRVSPGCAHCYALDLAARLKRMGQYRYQRDGDPKTSGPGFDLTLHSDKLGEPQRWRKPRMVFVNSMSDLFHEEIPDQFIAEVFAVMRIAEQHVFQVLTKRPERMRDLLCDPAFAVRVADAIGARGFHDGVPANGPIADNVWLGVSIENRRFVSRADHLRQTPAAVRFISAEPLLGPLIPFAEIDSEIGELENAKVVPRQFTDRYWKDGYQGHGLDLTDIDWLIVGGESGKDHRPINEDWVRDLHRAAAATGSRCDNCEGLGQYLRAAEDGGPNYPAVCDDCRGRGRHGGTAFFFKQWGGRTPKAGGRELDGRTWDEFPAARTQPTTGAV